MCVVGDGFSALAHAAEARRRGLSVVVLEPGPRTYSNRPSGIGHLFFSALASGTALDAAETARERWLEFGARAGILVDGGGTLIVARNGQELAVMEQATAEAGRRARMLTRAKVGSLVPIPVDGVMGGLHAPFDLRFDPRTAAARLTRMLEHDRSVRIEWNAPVHEVAPGVVHSGRLAVRALATVLCPGPSAVGPGADAGPVRTSRPVQYLRLAAPSGSRYRAVLLDGASLLSYPGLANQPGSDDLQARCELERPDLADCGVRPHVAQLPDGDLLVGVADAHPGSESGVLFERPAQLLLEQVQRLLGVGLRVRERWSTNGAEWQAAFPEVTQAGDPYWIGAPFDGLRLVQARSPLAPALCHVTAAAVLDELLDDGLHAGISGIADDSRTPDIGYMRVRDLRKSNVTASERAGLHAHAHAFGVRRPGR